jgi:uncharacterized repeat protein (TIGR02543 family)
LADVTGWELWGGASTAPETLLEEFSTPEDKTVYLEAGDSWHFTLEGYKGEDLILRGAIADKNIVLEGPNVLNFSMAPVALEGNGTVKITINLPGGHGISTAKVFKDGTELSPITPITNPIVFEADYAAGDYYFSFLLYKGSDLYGVVSEAAQVRANLRSEKSYTLGREDLNLAYRISYNLNWGQFDAETANPGYYRSTDAVLVLPSPTRTGYDFGGWYEDSDFSGSAVEQIPQGGTEDREFYAAWSAITYTVAYNKNAADAAGTMNQSTHTYDEEQSLTANGFTRTGYAFAGWAVSSGGSVSHADSARVENLTAVDGDTVTLYAKWTAISYNITYHLNEGTDGGNPETYTIEDAIVLCPATRSGFAFQGWHSDAEFAMKVTGIPLGSTGDKSFYAQWAVIISSASITGLAAPITGNTPATTAGLSPGALSYTVQSLEWSPAVSGNFLGGISYSAVIVLKAAAGHQFSGTITPGTGGVGTPGAGTINADTEGNTLSFTVSFSATIVHLSAASISGLVAPITWDTPVTAADLSPGTSSYTAQSLEWSPTVNEVFAGGEFYSAAIVLKAAAGHQFSGTITPGTGGVGTPGAGTIDADAEGNTLSFTVSFPGTRAQGTVNNINITFAALEDEDFDLPEKTIYKVSYNTTDRPNTATLTVTPPVGIAYTDIQWRVNGAHESSADDSLTFALNATDYSLGTYLVTVEVWRGNIPYSKTIEFHVVY